MAKKTTKKTSVAKTTAAKTPAATKKALAKKAPAATKVKKAEKVKADRSMASDPPAERKKALISLLKKMKVTGATKARPVAEIAERLGYTKFDVYGLVNGTSGKAGSSSTCLVATGHAATASIEGERGISIYLTAKGAKTKFDESPFIRATKKADSVEV